MLTSQFGPPKPERTNVWVRIIVIVFMVMLFFFVIPLFIGILLSEGLIPSDGLTELFYIIIFPIIGVVAMIYVIWKS